MSLEYIIECLWTEKCNIQSISSFSKNILTSLSLTAVSSALVGVEARSLAEIAESVYIYQIVKKELKNKLKICRRLITSLTILYLLIRKSITGIDPVIVCGKAIAFLYGVEDEVCGETGDPPLPGVLVLVTLRLGDDQDLGVLHVKNASVRTPVRLDRLLD